MAERIYTPEIGQHVAEEVARGRSVRSVTEPLGIDESTPVVWRRRYPEFDELMKAAYEARAWRYAEQVEEIADDGKNDWMEQNDPENPGYRLNGEHVQRSRLRLDARKWLASKFLPKVFGEKVHQDTQTLGADGQPIDPPQPKVEFVLTIRDQNKD